MEYNKEIILYGDPFWCQIIKYLSVKDLYNLSKVNKYYRTKITDDVYKKNIMKCINDRLKELFENNYDDFKRLLDDYGVMLSGSFIIQCILDVKWMSDIDLYVPIFNEVREYKGENCDARLSLVSIDQEGTTEFETLLSKILVYHNNYDYSRYGDVVSNKITKVRQYRFSKNKTSFNEPIEWMELGHPKYEEMKNYNKPTVQTININIKNKDRLNELLMSIFDLDICKNFYGLVNGKEYLKIFKLHEILTMRTYFKIPNNSCSSIDRYYKYKQRGFKFINNIKPMFREIVEKNPYCQIFYLYPTREFDKRLFDLHTDTGVMFQLLKEISGEIFRFKITKSININIDEDKIKKAYAYIETLDNSSYGRISLCNDEVIIRCDSWHVRYPLHVIHRCSGRCPVRMCYEEKKKHFHMIGERLQLGEYIDYIFILSETIPSSSVKLEDNSLYEV